MLRGICEGGFCGGNSQFIRFIRFETYYVSRFYVRTILCFGERNAAEAPLALAVPSFLWTGVVRSLILALWAREAAAPAEDNLSGFQASMGFEFAFAREAAALAPALPSYVHAVGDVVC